LHRSRNPIERRGEVRFEVSAAAGVVDQDVQAAESGPRELDHRVDVVARSQIGEDRCGAAARFGGVRAACSVDVGQHDRFALGREAARDRSSGADRRASDHRGSPSDVHVRSPP